MALSFSANDKGILPDRMIAELAKAGGIVPIRPFAPDQIQPASLDLRLGNVAYERDGRGYLSAGQNIPLGPRERDYGEETGNAIDAEVRAIVDAVLERTLTLLRERRDALEQSARRLLEKETLDEAELLEFAGRAADQAAARRRATAAE